MLKLKIFVALILFCFTSVCCSVEPWTGLTKKDDSKMKYFMHTGFIFDATLKTGIFSFNMMTPVIAETEYDVIFLDKVILPKKSKLIGFSSVLQTADRVNVYFNTIVFPDGSELKFSGMALAVDGSAGIQGKVKKHREKIPAQILFGAVGAIAPTNLGGAVAQGLSNEGLKELNYTPSYSITVKKGTPILIYNIARIEY